jgi:23S rRNA (guanosine2251-2'-O)-methyltransferase
MLLLSNPHAVAAVLERRPQHVRAVLEGEDRRNHFEPVWRSVAELARAQGVTVTPPSGHGFGGPCALVHELAPQPVVQLFASPKRGLWLALDNLLEPANIGTIIRTASFFALDGILVLQDRAVPLNGEIYDHANGTFADVPFSVETDRAGALDAAKRAGLTIVGTDSQAQQTIEELRAPGPLLLVMGNERVGVDPYTLSRCDELVKITGNGPAPCLNVGVAAGICIANLVGRRNGVTADSAG